MAELKNYNFSNTKEFIDTAIKRGGKFIDGKILCMPRSMGHGEFFFTEVAPGFSIAMMDVVFTSEILFKRLKSEQNLYILQFDVSDEVNDIVVSDVIDEEDDLKIIKAPFSAISNQIEYIHKPTVGKRTFKVRLFVDKKVLNKYIRNSCKVNKNTSCTEKRCVLNGYKGKEIDGINCIGDSIFCLDYIDSKSKVLLHSLMKRSVFDPDFELFFTGITYKLYRKFINNYMTFHLDEIPQMDIDAILKTKEHLLSDLSGPFPSVSLLANMVGMSVSKYKTLFKEVCGETANQLFMKEKLILAQKMLQSGEFHSVNEVATLLNYSRKHYFSVKYFELFARDPSKDFVRKFWDD